MQVSELFRIGIVIPLNDVTKAQLNDGFATGVLDIRFQPLSQDEFYEIWDTGSFAQIERLLNIKIAEYENSFVEPESINSCLLIVQKCLQLNENRDAKSSLMKVYDSLLFAKEVNMPAHFIF